MSLISLFSKRRALMGFVVLVAWVMAPAQTRQYKKALSVDGSSGAVTVLQSQGRVFVDVQELARMTGGSVNFEKDRIVLVIPRGSGPDGTEDSSRFTPAFTSAAIQAMASIREWGGLVMTTVQNGYPVGNNLAGNSIAEYQARAADSIALASAAASTNADHRGLELLKGEFSNVQDWTQHFVDARRSLSAVKLTTSENAIYNDEDAQRALRCGQFLAEMFATGAIQEDAACR